MSSDRSLHCPSVSSFRGKLAAKLADSSLWSFYAELRRFISGLGEPLIKCPRYGTGDPRIGLLVTFVLYGSPSAGMSKDFSLFEGSVVSCMFCTLLAKLSSKVLKTGEPVCASAAIG